MKSYLLNKANTQLSSRNTLNETSHSRRHINKFPILFFFRQCFTNTQDVTRPTDWQSTCTSSSMPSTSTIDLPQRQVRRTAQSTQRVSAKKTTAHLPCFVVFKYMTTDHRQLSYIHLIIYATRAIYTQKHARHFLKLLYTFTVVFLTNYSLATKTGGAENAGMENAGLDFGGPNSRTGKCIWSAKFQSCIFSRPNRPM